MRVTEQLVDSQGCIGEIDVCVVKTGIMDYVFLRDAKDNHGLSVGEDADNYIYSLIKLKKCDDRRAAFYFIEEVRQKPYYYRLTVDRGEDRPLTVRFNILLDEQQIQWVEEILNLEQTELAIN